MLEIQQWTKNIESPPQNSPFSYLCIVLLVWYYSYSGRDSLLPSPYPLTSFPFKEISALLTVPLYSDKTIFPTFPLKERCPIKCQQSQCMKLPAKFFNLERDPCALFSFFLPSIWNVNTMAGAEQLFWNHETTCT